MNKKLLLVAGVLSIISSNVMGAVTTDVVRGKNIYVAKQQMLLEIMNLK